MKRISDSSSVNGTTLAKAYVDILCNAGVSDIFCIPGGPVYPLLDELSKTEIHLHRLGHEQSLVHAAEGYSFASGGIGVVIATSGPGGTNLLTGLADAWMDHRAILAIVGQVPRAVIGTRAFQEADVATMAAPVCKIATEPRTADQAIQVLQNALAEIVGHPRGPSLVSIPKDLWHERVSPERRCRTDWLPTTTPQPCRVLREPLNEIACAKRPVLLVGQGIHGFDKSILRTLIEQQRIPATSTLHALGYIDGSDPLWLGMVGMHGSRRANMAVMSCDLLLVLGARLDDRVTGVQATFGGGAKIIHIDLNAEQIARDVNVAYRLRTSVQEFVGAWAAEPSPEPGILHARTNWINDLSRHSLAKTEPGYLTMTESDHSPLTFFEVLGKHMDEEDVVVADVGQHQMWTAQFLSYRSPGRFLTSGGLGTMGFALPAAIGATLGGSYRRIWCITGDGGLVMSLQELAALAESQFQIGVVVINNSGLGLVKQWQDMFFKRRVLADFEYSWPFSKIGRALGIRAETVTNSDELDTFLRGNASLEPFLADVRVGNEWNVYPMVPPGASNAEMLP